MAAIFLTPNHDDTGRVHTINGIRECCFATVGDLESALRKAHIEPKRHRTELHELANGRGVRLSVSEAQRNAFFSEDHAEIDIDSSSLFTESDGFEADLASKEFPLAHSDYTLDKRPDRRQQRVWNYVSRSPLRSLWNLQGVPIRVVARRTWRALRADNILGRAAELGFFFLFALFPTLFSASSILGLAARSASEIYDSLLHYLALVVPTSALGTVIATFNETAAAASSRKLTFGLIASIWSASIGVSAIQDSLNAVYKVHDERSYIRSRISAIGITILLSVLATLTLTCMFGSDFLVALLHERMPSLMWSTILTVITRIVAWVCATALLSLSFAVIYYWAPGVKTHCWRWLTPGGAVGMFFWLLASLGLRVYLHFFNFYSLTYGSLGAVITLLMWFYITGFMLLLGAEINGEIEAAAVEKKLTGHIPSADTPPLFPVEGSGEQSVAAELYDHH